MGSMPLVIMFNLSFLVPFCLFYLRSYLSFSACKVWIWPSLWYPGKLVCFHDNVCRQSSVFVLSLIRSESVSSLLDRCTQTDTNKCTYIMSRTHNEDHWGRKRHEHWKKNLCQGYLYTNMDKCMCTHTHITKPSSSSLLTNNNIF